MASGDYHAWDVGAEEIAERLDVTPGAIFRSGRSRVDNPDVTGGPTRPGRHFVGNRGRAPQRSQAGPAGPPSTAFSRL